MAMKSRYLVSNSEGTGEAVADGFGDESWWNGLKQREVISHT